MCLFNNAAAFADDGRPVACKVMSIIDKESQMEFDNIPQGTYALVLFHDVNNNGKFDKNFLGIPKEGYGASKNKLPFAAAPKFDENKFVVTNNSTVYLPIKLRYIL
ncbi:MAG: hypothetical protein C4329_13040 [Chitinophagaceae bacterium]